MGGASWEVALDANLLAAECPISLPSGEILFVDVAGKCVHEWQPSTGDVRKVASFETYVSSVNPRRAGGESGTSRGGDVAGDVVGGLVVGVGDSLIALDRLSGRIGETLAKVHLPSRGPSDVFMFNDAKCDARGRLWVGDVNLKTHMGDASAPMGDLFMLAPPRYRSVSAVGAPTNPNPNPDPDHPPRDDPDPPRRLEPDFNFSPDPDLDRDPNFHSPGTPRPASAAKFCGIVDDNRNCNAVWNCLKMTRKFAGVGTSNGMAWDPDNRHMYYADSLIRTVHCFDFDELNGQISRPRNLIRFADDDGGPLVGNPDGMTVDVNGKLWVAMWSGGRIAQLDPETGKVILHVDLPAKFVTSCTFAGSDLSELIVTSMKPLKPGAGNEPGPHDGNLFRIRVPGAKGVSHTSSFDG